MIEFKKKKLRELYRSFANQCVVIIPIISLHGKLYTQLKVHWIYSRKHR